MSRKYLQGGGMQAWQFTLRGEAAGYRNKARPIGRALFVKRPRGSTSNQYKIKKTGHQRWSVFLVRVTGVEPTAPTRIAAQFSLRCKAAGYRNKARPIGRALFVKRPHGSTSNQCKKKRQAINDGLSLLVRVTGVEPAAS